MLEQIYLILKSIKSDIFLNIRSITEVPMDVEEFFSLYIENEDVSNLNQITTTYVVLFGIKRTDDEFSDMKALYEKTSNYTDFLLKNLPSSEANITYGTNDLYNFSLIKIPVKQRRKK